jgi:Transport protein Trs120 or TRAPPC9, TRAPP II complex subunit
MIIFAIASLMASSTSGNIFISYGCLHRSQSSLLSRPSETFHTRQVSYPVLVTVYDMLECHDMDIFPLSVGNCEAGETSAGKRRELFKDVEEEGWCLFTIDVRNAYGSPFEVTLERVQNGQETCSECDICLTVSLYRRYPNIDELYRGPRRDDTVREFQKSTGQASSDPQQDGLASQKVPAFRRGHFSGHPHAV